MNSAKAKTTALPDAVDELHATTGWAPLEAETSRESIISNSPLPRTADYVGIFLTSASILLFELTLTRIFAYMIWAHLAFMVVGTALFAFGLSGVYLALTRRTAPIQNRGALCLLISLSILTSYLVVINVPFKMWELGRGDIHYLYLLIWYFALLFPFFFAGLIIADLLSSFPRRSARLYGADLIGAALGSLLLIPVIPSIGAEGCVVFAALLACFGGIAFDSGRSKRSLKLLAVASLALALLLPVASRIVPIKLHQTKRLYNQAVEKGQILATRWSSISRVDVAEYRPKYRAIWIDGGTNESIMVRSPKSPDDVGRGRWQSIAAVHRLKDGKKPNTLIIGSSGGKEVWMSLFHGAAHIDAVEMDPSIAKFVNDPVYAEYMGRLYQNKRVNFVNDEGRSYLNRQPDSYYDVIQFVNNYTPVAMASGALNLSSTFLLTKESIQGFYRHLKNDGVLALHRGATLRVALTALDALRQLGVPEPEKHLIITNGEFSYFEGFFLKKTPWTKEEEQILSAYMRWVPRRNNVTFLWTPFDPGQDNIYSKVLSAGADKQKEYYTKLGVDLSPATDDRPFLEHFLRYGGKAVSDEAPEEFRFQNGRKWAGIIPRGDFPYTAILLESAVLALLFIGVPLFMRARSAVKAPGFFGILGYYSALGFGFIVVEICLMKRYVLFLGNPAYSITTVLIALLLSAGLGSVVSESIPFQKSRKALSLVVAGIVVALLFESLVSPAVFERFLGLPFPGRVLVSMLLLAPLGFLMGMPFALGLRVINMLPSPEEERRKLIAWAWGMNGYATVIGSAAAVFLALFFGFHTVLYIALSVYVLGTFVMLLATAVRTTY